MVCMAQNRIVKGVVFDADGSPLIGATVSDENSTTSTQSLDGGQFEISVSPYTKYVVATAEGYLTARAEIDGSHLILRLKVDKKYLAAKAKAEEEARIAAQKQAEAERIAREKEAAAKAKAEEAARIAAQKQAEAERIAKEKAEIAAAKKKKRDALRIEYAKPIKGYESFVSISNSMTNNESFIGADYIGGYRFNNIFFLGAGVGANMRLTTPISQIEINEALELSHGAFYFPAYAHFRAQLLNRRCTPFLALSAGYNISLPQSFDLELIRFNYNASGAFVNPQFGVTYRIKPKLGIYCAMGFNACMMLECIDNTGYSATIKQSFKYGINVNLGISF